ncbi:MAG: AAA family ATPase [Thermoguttaceae bacterium]|jgi:hypothetical protein|nr:AAA family ATPase [Thermoguttaceae bacterium]
MCQQQHHVRSTSTKRGRQVVPLLYFSSWRALTLPGAVGITAGKRGKRLPKTEENRLWTIKQYFVNAIAHDWYSSSSSSSGDEEESAFSAAMDKLNRAWQMFYPGQSFAVEPAGGDPDSGFDMFLDRPNQPRLAADLLSSGQLELFTFAGDLIISKWPQGIILIDEPELHLDPQWHRQVLKALQLLKPGCQIIVATHSPEIYDSVMSFERHFLVPDDDPRAKVWAEAIRAEEVGP